ncbi:3-oxoacyl-[acyl-carrier protein] reductase [Paramicrobacterium humi]|uniref:3-oxoacyl-[acyl-carrier protein] reductase n=1 Tax=Paramicrobacterium humi TaxID=640635 RepID=A0A1H4JI60_9MICO|nr:SDR family NAD(P)-dependent oxidoreductase [Microbacterium humi]SEB46004.1 3-oxoacyl-[acyl-carrier protein] reductase [Microbacterium humi]
MQIDLGGKVAIVTGAGRGIGREITLALAREGVITVALDLNSTDLENLSREVEAITPDAMHAVCDVRDADGIRSIVDTASENLGGIDILVNNAGVVGDALVDELDEGTWDLIQDVNVKGTFLMCRAVIPHMKRRGSGRIINAASFAAISPRVGSIAYATSKAAVAHFTRGLAGEVGPWNITVNAYAPGMIPTAMNHFAELPDDKKAELLDTLTLRRWGSAADIANLICFLSSDQASYITGTLIDVSGGKLATQIPSEAYDRFNAYGEEGVDPA